MLRLETTVCGTYSKQIVTDHRFVLRRPIQDPRTPKLGQVQKLGLWPKSSSGDNLPECWMHNH